MDENEKKAIQKCYVTLIKGLNMDVMSVTDTLLQKDVLTHQDTQRIRAGRGEYEQAQTLLDFLPRRPGAYQAFRSTLNEYRLSGLVDALDAANPGGAEKTRKAPLKERKPPKDPKDIKLTTRVFLQICDHGAILQSWRRFGGALGLSDGDLVSIQYKHRDNLKDIMYDVLTTWENQQGVDAPGRHLLQTLIDFHCTALADKLEKADSKDEHVANSVMDNEQCSLPVQESSLQPNLTNV